ncbi:MAG TPA: acyltransferase family protein [Gemmataceae bacterium]|jgi:peptidoglycan/LPS O-acetylase OafA/YrhL|nr:acyltransferase family protein [Gemmataceae bacterium]
MTPARPDRYHALDALRGFAMLLGILLHAAIPYLHTKFPAWPVQDRHRSVFFDVILLGIHDFRMQAFFLLAGFFGALLYARYGALGTITHRLKRIALPLAIAMVTVIPVLQAVSAYAAATVYVVNPAEAPGGEKFKEVLSAADTPSGVVGHFFTSGMFVNYLIPAHLWFLWYLLLCFAVMLPLALLADRLKDHAIGRACDAAAGWLFAARGRWLVLTVLTLPVMLLMSVPGVPDTPLTWLPIWHLLVYYLLFFVVGWTLYRHRDKLAEFARGWFAWLMIANLFVLPIGLFLFDLSQHPETADLVDAESLRLPLNAVLVLFSWLMIGGLLGLFLRFLSVERAWVRWLADSAYWCYLVSLPPVIVFQFWIADWDVPGVVKFLVVGAGTMAVVLATYRIGVRYTWIGRLLNGPRGHR